MGIIRALTEGQLEHIAVFRMKWEALTATEATGGRDLAVLALHGLYQELELTPPAQFLFYPGLEAAWADFSAWFPRIGRCLIAYWPYQLPLFDPASLWRKFGENRAVVDLAVRRSAKPNCAWISRPGDDVHGNILDAGVNRIIWTEFENTAGCNLAWRLRREVASRFADEHDLLADKADAEDPSCPIAVDEYVYLGPFPWLIQELACVDFCRAVLGCGVNARLYGSLTDLVRSGKTLLIFEHLCLICDRTKPGALW